MALPESVLNRELVSVSSEDTSISRGDSALTLMGSSTLLPSVTLTGSISSSSSSGSSFCCDAGANDTLGAKFLSYL